MRGQVPVPVPSSPRGSRVVPQRSAVPGAAPGRGGEPPRRWDLAAAEEPGPRALRPAGRRVRSAARAAGGLRGGREGRGRFPPAAASGEGGFICRSGWEASGVVCLHEDPLRRNNPRVSRGDVCPEVRPPPRVGRLSAAYPRAAGAGF